MVKENNKKKDEILKMQRERERLHEFLKWKLQQEQEQQ